MCTQWRVAPLGMGALLYIGLDYAALPPVLAAHRRVEHRQPLDELMPQLHTLELAARAELNRE